MRATPVSRPLLHMPKRSPQVLDLLLVRGFLAFRNLQRLEHIFHVVESLAERFHDAGHVVDYLMDDGRFGGFERPLRRPLGGGREAPLALRLGTGGPLGRRGRQSLGLGVGLGGGFGFGLHLGFGFRFVVRLGWFVSPPRPASLLFFLAPRFVSVKEWFVVSPFAFGKRVRVGRGIVLGNGLRCA